MHSTFYVTPADGVRLQRTILILTGLMYGHFALAAGQFLPFWTLLLTIPILMTRWMLAVHEIFHVCKPPQLDLVTRLLPMAFTPLALGFREFQNIHFRHHQYMCTPDDAEWFQIRGGYLSGFLNAVTSPDQALFRWVACRGIDRQLVGTLILQSTVFFGLIYLTGWNFLWYWIPARISYGVGSFVFFYMLHRRGKNFGVYALQLPAGLARIYALLFGNEALQVTCHHDLHHENPRIAGHALESASHVINIKKR